MVLSALSAVLKETHIVQLAVTAAVALLNVIGLVLLNRQKGKKAGGPPTSERSWELRRNALWTLIASSVLCSWWLDVHFPIHPKALPIKAYVMAFPLGLLDFHFSRTSAVSLKVFAGAALWCSTIYVREHLVDTYFDRPVPPVIVREFGVATLLRELARFVLSLPFIGILSDLNFSPMHRAAHHPRIYKEHHKAHHEYTNDLTALVIYHGTLLDDFLMPLCAAFGGALYHILAGRLFGLEESAFSSIGGYLMIFNTLLSHAHDIRCARLIAPLPDALNFVAYHYVHHLSPVNNYGLTEPSDLIWDLVLGVRTIRKLEDFDLATFRLRKQA